MKKPPPTVAVIAGLDPTGGAGLAADIHAVTDAGAHPLPLMTANTIQGQGIATRFEVVEPVFLSDQLNAVFQNHKPGAIKLGMLGSPEAVQALVSALEKWSVMAPLIMDPVRSASSGGDLVGVGMRKELLNLLQYTVLITPNRDELSWLTGCEVSTESEIEDAVVFLGEHGCGSILVKGGHSKGAPVDTLYTQGIPV